ncbi:helix-turn-helix transcriptional regulator [Pseudomaricurvus alkylphenolicus]|uniref:helix-turn-helix domain-containing protein n=1 Tax=Pseudomaricurvus alkylphenolicus TaxID=1306991 RepID=UPI00141E4AA8|nr:AraC family transcriptional regulator [Pseudomaricurvus alkylphenolicus]NIB38181.1 helix-turn-helix transcriptional regulator [Pseudomaricurvus alkylphenolicus]
MSLSTSLYQATPLELFHGKPLVAGTLLDSANTGSTIIENSSPCCQISCGGNLVKISPTPENQDNYIESFRLSPYASCSIVRLSVDSGFEMNFDGNDLMGFSIGLSGRGEFPSIGPIAVEEGNPFVSLFFAPSNSQVSIAPDQDRDNQSVNFLFKKALIEQALGMSKQELPEQLMEFWSNANNNYQLQSLNLPYHAVELAGQMLNSPEHNNLRYLRLLSLANTMMFEFMQSFSQIETGAINKDNKLLARAKTLLEQNLAGHYSLNELARDVGLCRSKLTAGFKDQYGTTVADYHRDLRLNEAHRLITQTDKSVALIAEETGFSSSNHFATAFKRRFKRTPSEIRKMKSGSVL